MKASELLKLSMKELQNMLFKQNLRGFALNMEKAAGKLTQSHLVRENRRLVARIKTVMADKRKSS